MKNQKGFALPLVLGFAMVFSMGIAGLLTYATSTARQISIERQKIKSFYIAEAATEKALAQIKQLYSAGGPASQAAFQTYVTSMQSELPNVGADYFTYNGVSMTLGAQSYTTLATGDYIGLNGSVQTLTVAVTAADAHHSTTTPVTLAQDIQIQLIPVFQFGVFYQNDLEILPGPTMTFAGPVHSNKDIYMGVRSGGTLSFDSTITSHGNINHGRKDDPSDTMPGNVFIEDATNTDQNMLNAGVWLDSTESDWATESQNRWDGNVKSIDHGVQSLNIPLPVNSDQHTLIERRDASDSVEIQKQKLDYKAQIRLIDGVTQNANGVALDFRYCQNNTTQVVTALPGSGTCPGGTTLRNPVSSTSFYNFREGKTIQSTDLNVGYLNNSPAFKAIADDPANKGVVIYHSDHRNAGSASNQDAFRLTGGSTLYQGTSTGATFVSENPLYVKGDFNSSTTASIKRPVGLVGDSMNILSNAWVDSKSAQSLANRTASATTVQAAVIAGNTETTTGNYNGGFENVHRFLEGWSSKTLTYKGSVIVLYNSEIATGPWVYGGNYYTAPNRSWSFDTAFSDPNYSIPGFPSVYQVIRSEWRVE